MLSCRPDQTRLNDQDDQDDQDYQDDQDDQDDHRFNQHLTGPYYTQLFHKAQPTHSYMAQMLVIMDVRYVISTICMRYVAYSLWKVRCEVKVVYD